jgi:hypothetical protein
MAIRLRANVEASAERARKYREALTAGVGACDDVELPAWLEISEEYDAYFLLYFQADGALIADGWHVSLEHAMRQAAFELGITEDQWRPVEEGIADRGSGIGTYDER